MGKKSSNSQAEPESAESWGKFFKKAFKPVLSIAVITACSVLGGPLGGVVAASAVACLSRKSDKKNEKNAENEKSGKSAKDEKNAKNERPGWLKRVAFGAAAIGAGILTGGLLGVGVAAALIIGDYLSEGKLTEWSTNAIKAVPTLGKEAWSFLTESQTMSKRDKAVETGQSEEVGRIKSQEADRTRGQKEPGKPKEPIKNTLSPELRRQILESSGLRDLPRGSLSPAQKLDVGKQQSAAQDVSQANRPSLSRGSSSGSAENLDAAKLPKRQDSGLDRQINGSGELPEGNSGVHGSRLKEARARGGGVQVQK